MTIESNLTIYRSMGLRKSELTNVVDYKQFTDGDLSTPQQERMMLLDIVDRDQFKVKYAEVTSEDAVEIVIVDFINGQREVVYSIVGSAINSAKIVRFDGLERWVHRETREGDYPEPEKGKVMTPIQLKAGLV